jgi:BirA family biotin operon repressor/biotin-[acetyl-CoA-carboxylase] ligase
MEPRGIAVPMSLCSPAKYFMRILQYPVYAHRLRLDHRCRAVRFWALHYVNLIVYFMVNGGWELVLDPYIIERLRRSAVPVSGQVMARESGLSRVALWKRIEALKAWGYGIEASHRGYVLVHDDGLAPWDFEAPGPVHLFDDIPSTMDKAHALAQAGAPSGTMVLALRQSAGRNRSGALWISPAGGLYLSLVLRSALPPALAGSLVLEAARTTLGLLKEAGACGLAFEWPGAFLAGPGRLGGLLLEYAGAMGRVDYYVLGVGINVAPVSTGVPGTDGMAADGGRFVSLGELNGKPPQRARLAADIARALTNWAADPVLAPGRWASLLPDGPHSALLWTGELLDILPVAYTARGELSCADGRVLSIGECTKLQPKGAST